MEEVRKYPKKKVNHQKVKKTVEVPVISFDEEKSKTVVNLVNNVDDKSRQVLFFTEMSEKQSNYHRYLNFT